ncbi:hypothetical protein DUNSADRAFT_13028 [Dunaliella salina]|uniref:Encoded protein n=1 Tax=Dunaliella salina TaxID=3046 RepID=A0ABQ7GA62_DUNSA|nr:hypothetical protein DUNSADRAFT_13028 [Dunaliella salina]|eukprot:KAF5831498.1 hypothetical protein DUNSADRAFT_13028 [Dunaliella salina]
MPSKAKKAVTPLNSSFYLYFYSCQVVHRGKHQAPLAKQSNVVAFLCQPHGRPFFSMFQNTRMHQATIPHSLQNMKAQATETSQQARYTLAIGSKHILTQDTGTRKAWQEWRQRPDKECPFYFAGNKWSEQKKPSL